MFNHLDKAKNVGVLNRYMLAKTLAMFEWEGLPPSIPSKELEKLLQKNGAAFITKHDGQLYAFAGNTGGVQDVYGNNTTVVVSNPALKLNETFNIEKDGVLARNDDLGLGIMPIFDHYNTLMVENEISMVVYGYNTRLSRLISASDDATKASAEKALKDIVDGKISVVGESVIFDGMKVHDAGGQTGQTLKTLIEYQQYLKATLQNELGISANTNLKRERLLGAEVEQSEDGLFAFVYSMMKARIEAAMVLNERFGLNVTVGFGSVWKDKQAEAVDGVVKPNQEESDNAIEKSIDPASGEGDMGQGDAGDDRGRERERGRDQAPSTETSPNPQTEIEAELALIEEQLGEFGITEEEREILEQLKAETLARKETTE